MMEATESLIEMKEVFTKCQTGLHTHPQLIKRLTKVYKKIESKQFIAEFNHCINYFLIEYRREPAVERGIEFITKFTVSLVVPSKAGAEVEVEENEDQQIPYFVLHLFDYLLKHNNASGRGVRFRCCQMIHKLLNCLGEHAHIDDDLYDNIFNAMMVRLRDKFPAIKVQAIHALTRLQDPRDTNCPVINALMFLMTCDPHPDVRKAALTNIALSKKTLKEVLTRTRDVKETVRVTAYKIISEKIHIRALTIAERVKLLQDGLSDRSESVRSTFAKGLLQTWLGQYGGNILEVLERLDVEESHTTVTKALDQLFKHHEDARLVKDFDVIDDELLIPLEKLSPENSFYWWSLCRYLRAQGDQNDELVDKILPTPLTFTKYLKKVVANYAAMSSIDDTLRNEFVLRQLIELLGCLDLADTAGRNAVEELLRELLLDDDISDRLVEPLVKRLRAIHVIDEKDHVTYEPGHVTKLVEIIADIRVPVNSLQTQPDVSSDQIQNRKIQLQLAGLRVKLNQVREDLSESVDNQDFTRAALLKEQISLLEAERDEIELDSVKETDVIDETRIERNDPAVLLKCLTISSEMLYHLKMTSLNPVLRTLMETSLIPGIMTEDPAVRRQSIRALGLCCLMEKRAAREHFLLFLQICQVDLESIRTMAMTVVFDVIITHGLECFETINESDKPEVESESDNPEENSPPLFGSDEDEEEGEKRNKENEIGRTVNSIVSVLSSWLDNESCEIRTCAAQGLAKLMATGRVTSPKLLSRLLILWYNPLTEDDTTLRHFLGTFFSIFAFDCSVNQEIIEEAFVPTLRTFLDAPVSSPLSAVNVKNVLDLLIQLSDWRLLAVNRSRPTENMIEHNIHNNLAVRLCNEIISDHDNESVSLLCWSLNQLNLNTGELSTMQDLLVMAKRITQIVQNRLALRSVDRFVKSLHSHIKEQPPATPLSKPRDGTRSRIRRSQSKSKNADGRVDSDPSIDDYTPPESNSNVRVHGNCSPSNARGSPGATNGSKERKDESVNQCDDGQDKPGDHGDGSQDEGGSQGDDSHDEAGSQGDGSQGEVGSHGDSSQDVRMSQEESSQGEEVVSDASQSELMFSDTSDNSSTRTATRNRTSKGGRLTKAAVLAVSSTSATNVRRSARKPASNNSKTDSELENEVFASPAISSISSQRSTRASAQRQSKRNTRTGSGDVTDSDSDPGHVLGRTKRKGPNVLLDIENCS